MAGSAEKKKVVERVAAHGEDFIAIADELYRFPETGLDEHRAAALLTARLEAAGFKVERGIGELPTAFRAAWGSAGPRIAILAEMDALPEIGHACGHNIIAAAAIGAAVVLREVLPPEAARIVVIGTPAEELGIGKVDLIAHGHFADVDFAMMVHPSSRRQVVKGSLGLAKVRFTFFGKAAHAAAYPEEGINALDAVLQTFNGINALRQHVRQDVRIHGIITEGGTAPNVVPERSSCYFYIRAGDLAEVAAVRERVLACAEGGARSTGCRLETESEERILAPFRVNRSFSGLYAAQLAYLGLAEAEAPSDRNRGSSDIGNVSQVVPTIHPHVPIGEGLKIHTADFARATVSEQGKKAVLEGAMTMALTGVDLAMCPDLREKIVGEFRFAQ